MYFITVCTQNREYLFGDIVRANHDSPQPNMILNDFGKTVDSVWQSLPNRFPIKLDAFQIMPNHVHLIINIVGAIHESPDLIPANQDGAHRDAPLQRSLLSQCIGYFKMNSTKLIHQIDPQVKIWQRNFYEHIVRNENEINRIREYIMHNPLRWQFDKENPECVNVGVGLKPTLTG